MSTATQVTTDPSPRFELRFTSLYDGGRGFAFPCDPSGRVDLDALSERARLNYFFARATIGSEVGWPDVRPAACGVSH